MNVSYAFACLVVTDRDRAATWYERLFGKPPDFLPTEDEAVWQVAPTASMYILADAERAGRGIVTLIVDDLDATLLEIEGRGIIAGRFNEVTGAGRKSVIKDPDGNEVALVELLPST